MALALGIAALAVSIVAVVITYGAKRAAGRSADAALAADRRARTPQLAVLLDHPELEPGELAIYRVRNDGPQDLDEVVIYRPRPPDRITYPIALTGGPGAGGSGWADDEVTLGPLALGEERNITLACGTAPELPEFRVRVLARAGADHWEQLVLLPPPPTPPGVRYS